MIKNNASAGIDMSERQKQTQKDLDKEPTNQTKMVCHLGDSNRLALE